MMMIVNGPILLMAIWEETVSVTPSADYTFSYWGAEVATTVPRCPVLSLKINGKVIGNSVFPGRSPENGGPWQNYQFIWNSGTSQSADLDLYNLNTDMS